MEFNMAPVEGIYRPMDRVVRKSYAIHAGADLMESVSTTYAKTTMPSFFWQPGIVGASVNSSMPHLQVLPAQSLVTFPWQIHIKSFNGKFFQCRSSSCVLKHLFRNRCSIIID